MSRLVNGVDDKVFSCPAAQHINRQVMVLLNVPLVCVRLQFADYFMLLTLADQ